MSRNPYFAHLPTWRNRQDLAFALDSLTQILLSISSSTRHYYYPSPPPSPCAFSRSSSSAATTVVDPPSIPHPQHIQRYVERHLYRQHSLLTNSSSLSLQFSTRAQAMAFLIELLRALQTEPCGCDLVQGCFCSPDGVVEDHSGMAPCYICGEWFAEQVYCRDERTMELYQVDGRRWHEQAGTSIRHQLTESRVRTWLEQVVATAGHQHPHQHQPQHQHQQQIQWMQYSSHEYPHPQPQPQPQQPQYLPQCQHPQPKRASTYVIEADRAIPERSASAPASFMIPQEILDPSCRSPGFRIRSKKDHPLSVTPRSSSSSLRFCYTSERFKTAFQESVAKTVVPIAATSMEICAKDVSEAEAEAKAKEADVASIQVLMQVDELILSDADADADAYAEPAVPHGRSIDTALAMEHVTHTEHAEETQADMPNTTASAAAAAAAAAASMRYHEEQGRLRTGPSDVTSSRKLRHKDSMDRLWMRLRRQPSTPSFSETGTRRSEEGFLEKHPAIKRMRFESFPLIKKRVSRDALATLAVPSPEQQQQQQQQQQPLAHALASSWNNFEPVPQAPLTTTTITPTTALDYTASPQPPITKPATGSHRWSIVHKVLTKLSKPGLRHSRSHGSVSLTMEVA
ncbi:hypothetical protein BGZ70_002071 [Mortierella alpina]|uniref:Uncharacterized protein n=1 Tax=Mortierella alpina TaxID=64518 RepID=A0A9P6IUP6_MORAP|nr:hypothetical protein BGZ70_002071 [Mortierella alpina]